ncbi:MAG: sigma-54-dependent Fis family transcriptional regulator [Bacteroidetes bacterium GWA2_30_7]|nr:MAG: sigma-54-dependent Fis family transcriptional regulator [Bacteroidetes bacterium GWA2_30_7]
MTKGTILIVDDEEKLRQLMSRILELEGYQIIQAQNIKSAISHLEQNQNIDLVLSDVKLPDGNGLEQINNYKKINTNCEVILLTAYGTINDGVKAMKLGAFDYITKGTHDEQLILAIEKAMSKVVMHRRIFDLENKLEIKFNFDNIIGNSRPINETKKMALKVAGTDSTILIEGETGSGKELFAQSIHNSSNRKNNSFIAINCCAIPHELLESELFGHKKGAFTGAINDKKGLFEEAHEGTLFLDEIGDMNHDLQAKLLRIIETQVFTRIGETNPKKVNVRIIAATNKNLEAECEKGSFRFDLYYRLSAFKIYVPALRNRIEDIEQLTNYFISVYSEKIKKKIIGYDSDFLKILKQYYWKGNIRELRNILERTIILSENDILDSSLLPSEIKNNNLNLKPENNSLDYIESEHIRKVLNSTNGNKPETAKILNIGLTTLYRKIQEFNL